METYISRQPAERDADDIDGYVSLSLVFFSSLPEAKK